MFRKLKLFLIIILGTTFLAACDTKSFMEDVFSVMEYSVEESAYEENTIEDSSDKGNVVVESTTENNAVEEGQAKTEIIETTECEDTDTTETTMEVHFIDVGQGDATLVICDDEAMLIDAGPGGKGTLLQAYLRKQDVSELEYLILTHTDADHIGSADVIVNKFDIHTVFMGDFPKENKTYLGLLDAFEYFRLDFSTPNVGNVYALGDATITIVAPNRKYDNPNDSSIAFMLQHGENRFLFTGDATWDAEQDMLANGMDLDCDVYQAGHHGSSTSSHEEFLNAITPEYSVISCETGNSYGHPHAEVLNNFRKMGIKVFRTDEQGSIVAYSDGENITWNCAPSESWQVGE